MKASVFYRIAAVLLLLFDAGHTLGFPWSDPKWGVDLGSMQSTHFYIMGFDRTYWDFYAGFGLFVSVFLLLVVVLAWQLGGLPAESLARMHGTAWVFALCFAAITILSWKYFFIIPIVFSIVITVCLTVAAWLSTKQVPGPHCDNKGVKDSKLAPQPKAVRVPSWIRTKFGNSAT